MILKTRELRTAIYNRLISGSILNAGNVTSDPGTNEVYPFVFIGEVVTTDDSAKKCPLLIATVTLHIYDHASNTINIDEYANQCTTLITTSNSQGAEYTKLTMTSYTIVNQFIVSYNVIPDVDPGYRQGVLTMEFWLDEK